MNIIRKFKLGLKKTSNLLTTNIISSIKSKKINPETIEEIESALITADIGLEVTNELITKIKLAIIPDTNESSFVLELLAKEIEKILIVREKSLIDSNNHFLTVLLFIGVNGSGKTTTIGKLIKKISLSKKILVAACDTFRAAAVDQLKNWVEKKDVDFFRGSFEQDPASVAFSACQKAQNEKYDYLIIDTAGRLSNNTNLLNQLVKIKSVVNKSISEKFIKTILVLDGTNGSNMINQVDIFSKSLDVSGLIITKIDGTAKGGALISIAKKYEIPIHCIGLGEKDDDLFEFNAKKFSRSLLDLDD